MTILIVEDNVKLAANLRDLLRLEGHGSDALELGFRLGRQALAQGAANLLTLAS